MLKVLFSALLLTTMIQPSAWADVREGSDQQISRSLVQLILKTNFSNCTTYEAFAGNVWIESNNRYPYHGDKLTSLTEFAQIKILQHSIVVNDVSRGQEPSEMIVDLDLFGTAVQALRIKGSYQGESISITCTPGTWVRP